MGPDTFYELSKRSIILSKNEETKLTWDNSYLTVRTDKGTQFINFSYDLECLDKHIECLETTMNAPKDCPDSELFKAKFLKHEMRNADMSEMILDSALWPHNQQLIQEMTLVTDFLWSPKSFLHNEGILAILTNIGSVEFFYMQDLKCVSLLKLSMYVKKYLEYDKSPKSFKDLKNSAYVICTWSMCWSPNINSDNSCYFVTAQMDGTILFWSIERNITKTCIKGRFKGVSGCEITSMIWIPKSDDKFWLLCADELGQVLAYECRTENDEIKLNQCFTLWNYEDRMIAKNMKYEIKQNRILFICSKHRHLLVQVIDDHGKVVSQYLNNLNDYRITCIINTIEGFFVATVNCKVYKVNISISNDSLNVRHVAVEMKETYPTYELYSICFTSNNVILALGIIDRKVLFRKEPLKIDIVLLSTEKKIESIIPCLESANSLTYHGDCIEVLRYKMVKQKEVPQIDYDLSPTRNSIHKLKICLIIAIVYNKMKKAAKLGSEVVIPYCSVETLREQILLLTAISLLEKLHEKYQKESTLNSLEDESFVGAKQYLTYYCQKYKKDASEFIDISIFNVPNSNYEYICQCCDEKIEGFFCKSGHLNGFCSQTFTPICGYDYLVCKCCGYTVRPELSIENPLCVFCDLHLVNSFTQSK